MYTYVRMRECVCACAKLIAFNSMRSHGRRRMIGWVDEGGEVTGAENWRGKKMRVL